jgi:hypothetical protein
MKPLFSTPLLVPLTVSVSLILLSASTPTISAESSRDLAYRMVNEAIDWVDHSKSIGRLKDGDSIAHLMATCEPKTRRGPKPAPESRSERNTTKEVRYLRWWLESSYVFERKKAGDRCNWWGRRNPRSYLQLLMSKHFGNITVNGNDSLTVPGMETKEEEAAYEGVRAQLYGEHREWWKAKLLVIRMKKELRGKRTRRRRREGMTMMARTEVSSVLHPHPPRALLLGRRSLIRPGRRTEL